MIDDLTALTHWFPLLDAAGLPVPKTRILMMPAAAQKCMWAGFDGKPGMPSDVVALRDFAKKLQIAVIEVGGPPAFLRTAHTSDKHNWRRSCYIADGSVNELKQRVFNLAEASEMADIMGLPWDTWVVREFLPTIPWTTCPNYRGMPVCREYRVFVVEGRVCCLHPYWPEAALIEGGVSSAALAEGDMGGLDYDAFITLTSDELAALTDLAKRAGRAVPGAWSVDILETQRGWMITDMAEAHKSWHEWPECTMHYDQRRTP